MDVLPSIGHGFEGRIRRSFVAVLAVAGAFVLTMVLAPVVEADVTPIFLAAVMVSAWRGGLVAGLLATALSCLVRVFFFLPPHYSLTLETRGVEEIGVFVLAAVIISSLSAAREEALAREQVARREAEAANAVKDEFLAAVSHELRTPLTTIKTLTRILLRKETSKQERLEYLGDIASECDRQIDLVNNLLDVSRIRAGGVPIVPRRVDAGEVVLACERIQRVEAAERGHDLAVEVAPELPAVRADHAALRRALSSVVDNAIKYTADGGTIRIRARDGGDGYVAIEIADTGRGIRSEDVPQIFDSFFRGRPGESPGAAEIDVPGIGLGLYLARVLVEGMNGTISARSHQGKGSTFTLRIPIWRDEPEAEGERAGEAHVPVANV